MPLCLRLDYLLRAKNYKRKPVMGYMSVMNNAQTAEFSALIRLEEGEYGYCQDCGEDIAPKRLQLDPAASKCISCARA